MTPYYQDDAVTLYLGDCQEVIPSLPEVDIVVTDPPFFLPAQIGQSRKAWPRSLGNLAVMEAFFRLTLPLAAARLRRTGAFYCFNDSTSYPVALAACYPVFDRTHCLAWDKGVGGLGNGWRHSHELILHGAFSETVYADGFRRDVLAARPMPSDERGHPSEKPVDLIAQLLAAHPPGIVLDPFAGGGGILRAAKDCGWRAVGVEIDEAFCEATARRLAQESLFKPAPARRDAEQLGLLDNEPPPETP